MLSGHKNAFDCIKAFSETDFTGDLKKFDVPTLILHGDDDQIVPIGAAGQASAKLVDGRHTQGLHGCPARLHRDAQGPAQRRSARVPTGINWARRHG